MNAQRTLALLARALLTVSLTMSFAGPAAASGPPPAIVTSLPGAPTRTTAAPPKRRPEPVHLDAVGAVVGVHLGFAAWTYFAWYKKQVRSDHFLWRDEGWFGPETYAGGSDKLGHAMANYALTRGTAQLLDSAGLGPAARLILANLLTMTSFVVVEIKDGYHDNFGFSWGDIIANLTGNVIGTTMELWPALDRALDLRLEYVPSRDYLSALSSDDANVGEDYSGMRFAAYLKGSAIDWRFAKLYGAEQLLRYVNIGVAYQTIGFKPIRRTVRRQIITLRVALDVQVLIDDYVYGGRRANSGGLAHFASEMLTLPLTSRGPKLYEIRRVSAP